MAEPTAVPKWYKVLIPLDIAFINAADRPTPPLTLINSSFFILFITWKWVLITPHPTLMTKI